MTVTPMVNEGEPQSGHDLPYRHADPPISRTVGADD